MTPDPDPGDPSDKPGVHVKTHPSLCVGWGNCHRFAPDVYPLDAEGKIDIHLLDVPEHLAYDAWLGAGACPEQVITVIGPSFRHFAELREQQRLAAAHDHPHNHDR